MLPLDDLDTRFMQQALTLARSAPLIGEVPIAALLVHEGIVIAQAHNLRETRQDPTAHAEVIVIQDAARHMCIGAIVLARIARLVFGATDPKAGACGSIMNIPPEPRLNHRVEVVGGVCAEESQALLQDFFRQLRKDAARREIT